MEFWYKIDFSVNGEKFTQSEPYATTRERLRTIKNKIFWKYLGKLHPVSDIRIDNAAKARHDALLHQARTVGTAFE